jgi:DNA repair protein RadA/Sms
MLVAVTERVATLRMFDKDLFVATIGGMRLSDPSSDLAVCLAIASAGHDSLIPIDVAAIGEVTLAGEIRPVPMANQRIAEAARLGYRRVLVPHGTAESVDSRDAQLIEVRTLKAAYSAVSNLR